MAECKPRSGETIGSAPSSERRPAKPAAPRVTPLFRRASSFALALAGASALTGLASAQVQTTPELPAAPAPTTNTATGLTLGGSTGGAVSGTTNGSSPIQLPTQSSLFNPYLGSVQARPASPEVVPLSLDDAFHLGIENNLGLIYAKQSQRQDQAQRLQVLNVLLPNLDLQGSTALHQFNLESEGFRPDILPEFASLFPAGSGNITFPFVVKVDVTQGQLVFSQYLFDLAGFDLVKALGHLIKSTVQTSASSRGSVVQNVGTAYLRVVAAQSQIVYDQTLLKTDEAVLYQSQQEHEAGILANLDELRARVQVQTQQQALIADTNTLAKSKIALNREIGLAPEQEISVSDQTPFPALEAITPEAAEHEALDARQDYQSAIEQLRAAELERKAATRERVPTLIFNSDYGVTGISGGIYHGTFAAVGTLNIPIFQEAKFRSDRDTTEFMLQNARAQASSLRQQISQQVRSDLIDLDSTAATVTLAKSSVQLAQTSLGLSIERFRAGIEDNLPSVTAASTLAQAEVQAINAEFQFNLAKVNLARDLGRIDVNFHPEWQGGRPAGVLSDRAAMGR